MAGNRMCSTLSLENYSIFMFFLSYWDAFADNVLPENAYQIQKQNYRKLYEIWVKNL